MKGLSRSRRLIECAAFMYSQRSAIRSFTWGCTTLLSSTARNVSFGVADPGGLSEEGGSSAAAAGKYSNSVPTGQVISQEASAQSKLCPSFDRHRQADLRRVGLSLREEFGDPGGVTGA